MKICFVTIDYHSLEGGGGIGSYLCTLTLELSRAGHEVSIVCGGGRNEPDYEENGGVEIHRVHFGNLHYFFSKIPFACRLLTLPVRELEWSLPLWKEVRELHGKMKFDIVESCETGNLFSTLFSHGVPWVIRAHGATYSFKKFSGEPIGPSEMIDRALQRFCMKKAAGMSAPSRFQAREIEAEIGEKANVVPIANPIDSRFFLEATPTQKDFQVKKILYAGRIEIRKGTLVLLRAMGRVIRSYPKVKLIIAGGRHVSVTTGMLDRALDSAGIRHHVEFLGHVPWQKLPALYQSCHIFAVPSFYETFCISAAEAMACGKPVVGAFGSALPEVVEDGKTGFLIPPGDEIALAEALLKLLNDDLLARRMGEAGRQKAMIHYQANIVAEKALGFYKKIVTMSGYKEAVSPPCL